MPTLRYLRRILWPFIMAALLLTGGSCASEIRIEGNGRPVASTYFGMHIHRADTTTVWPIARFGTWRLWDAAVSWERLEPQQDVWDFRRLDTLVELAERNDIELMYTLGITPRWAASRPHEKFVYGYGGNSPPRDMRDWEDYVRTVATRYRGRIKYFELWNEPTFDEIDKGRGFYAGSASTMVELGRIAYRVIKAVDPENKLISPGFTDEGQRLDLFLSLGGKDITDIVAHHFYPEKPELLPGRIGHIRKVMAKHGLAHLPVWDTESGYWLGTPGEKTSPNWPHSDEELAGYMARVLALGAAAGLDRFYWYSWEKTMLNRQPPAIQSNVVIRAYMQTMRWLRGARVDTCVTKDRRVWICELTQEGRKARMVWSQGSPVPWVPPQEWQVIQIETLDARAMPYQQGETLQLGPAPLLARSEWRASVEHRDGN